VITDPIYGHLDRLAEMREDDLERLSLRRTKMKEENYLRKKTAIETRDEEVEKRWNEIIDTVYSLDFDDLIALQKLFHGEVLPPLAEVENFLRAKSKKSA
jgi:hypothetical protein